MLNHHCLIVIWSNASLQKEHASVQVVFKFQTAVMLVLAEVPEQKPEPASPWDLFARGVGCGSSARRSSVSLAPGLDGHTAACICSNLGKVFSSPEAEHFKTTLGDFFFIAHENNSFVSITTFVCEDHVQQEQPWHMT